MLFLEIDQYGKIEKAQRDASDAKRNTKTFERRIEDLERRTDRLALACQALWELLQERTDVSEDRVFGKMQEIDLRDGRADGQMGGEIFLCESCGRTCSSHRPSCVYCGHENRVRHIVK